MFRPMFFACLALTLAAPAGVLAQAVASQPVRIVITKTDCGRLVRHVPSADVAYQPGMDAKGRPVAPADLPGSGAAGTPGLLPDVLEIPLSIKPMAGAGYDRYGLGDSQMGLGTVKYDMAKGTFTLNGKPLGDPEQHALAEACRKRGVK